MKSDHQKMRGLIAAVIARANLMEINWHNGAWDIQRAIKLYGVVKHLFAYPSKSTQVCQNDQISWRTVYNIYEEWEDICFRGRHGDWCGSGGH
jgi:hypothetical protein